MKELFLIGEAAEGSYLASAVGQSIVTAADTPAELKASIKDATLCHFDEGEAPEIVHFTR